MVKNVNTLENGIRLCHVSVFHHDVKMLFSVLPICSIVKIITLGSHGRPDVLLHEAKIDNYSIRQRPGAIVHQVVLGTER